MSNPVGPGRPPAATRFRKGQSGNPKGRPRSKPQASGSAFNVVFERSLTLTQGGKAREVTVEEALQHRTYRDAIAGNRSARREVLKMIAKREKWLAARSIKHTPVELLSEPSDPDNAHEALILLGIAERDPAWVDQPDTYDRLLLQPWAVQAALGRRGSKSLSAKAVLEIKRCTRDAATLRWPKGAGE